MHVRAIVTVPPYADFIDEVVKHPLVDALRLNTIMPVKESLPELLQRLAGFGKPLWVDLKSRQLRVVGTAIPPFTEVQLSHRIQVDTPVDAYFSDGREHARVAAVKEDRLILVEGPRRMLGPGESVNIIHPSLKIEGVLSANDIAYLEAMRAEGLKNVMLSYIESEEDIQAVRKLLPNAEMILKVESLRGLDYLRTWTRDAGRLMAARGDLFIEVIQPHKMIPALQEIIKTDPTAIAASRLFDSLVEHPVPSSADICDAAFLLATGYRTFMLGDFICLRRETVLEALNLLEQSALAFR